MMFAGVSDVAPMGDDAKITDQMPFYNTFRYVPTRYRSPPADTTAGNAFRMGHHRHKDNPIASFRWTSSTAPRLRATAAGKSAPVPTTTCCSPQVRARPRDQHPQMGPARPYRDWADKPIQTYGYVAPALRPDSSAW